MKIFRITLLLIILFLMTTSSVNAANYYVSPNGLDTNSGTSSTSSYKTFSKAQSVAVSGDVIYVLAGTYTDTIKVTKAGLTIIGQNAVVDATGKWSAIEIHANNTNMEGFEAKHSNSHIVYITGKNVTFKNSYIHDGIYENRNASTELPKHSGWGSGLSMKHDVANGVERKAENVTIDNVRIERVYGEGLDMYGVSNITVKNSTIKDAYGIGFYIDNSHDIILDRNFAYCTGDPRFNRSNGSVMGGFSMALERLEDWYPNVDWDAKLFNIRITNNISYGCNGISMWGSEQPSGTPNNGLIDAVIAHNTVLRTPGTTPSIWFDALSGNRNIKVTNNLVSSSIANTAGMTSSGNITNVSYTASDLSNPLTIKPTNGRDLGVSNDVTIDFSGNNRDSRPDVGAFEISTGSQYNIADLEPDGDVDGHDFQTLISNFGLTGILGFIRSDIIKNGVVDIFDFNKLITNFGQ